MKKRNLSLGGRPGPLSHVSPSPFSRRNSMPGCDIASMPIESAKSDAHFEYGSQQESQSKHPFLSRSGHQLSSQSQRSLSQTCLTQSQSTQRFSQNSQPEEYGCEQWKKAFQDKEISLTQSKRPSPYFAGLTSSLTRRNVSGNVGGGSTPASPTCTSAPVCLVGPQNGTPRPWPQCNISEELEKRLGGLEKLREQETALLQKICDDYQQIKIFLEETCFESKDNRSKLLLQQNALHKLVKDEETANSGILAAIKAAEEVVMQDIRYLKQVVEGDAATNSSVLTSLKLVTESIREEIASFKKDLKAELQAGKQPVPIDNMHMVELIREDIASLKKDLNAELRAGKQTVPIDGAHYDYSIQTSHFLTDITETADKHSPVIPIPIREVVDLDEVPDSCPKAELGFDFLEADDACPASNTRSKARVPIRNRPDEQHNCIDDEIRRSIQRKIRRRAQKRIHGNMWSDEDARKRTNLSIVNFAGKGRKA